MRENGDILRRLRLSLPLPPCLLAGERRRVMSCNARPRDDLSADVVEVAANRSDHAVHTATYARNFLRACFSLSLCATVSLSTLARHRMTRSARNFKIPTECVSESISCRSFHLGFCKRRRIHSPFSLGLPLIQDEL